MELKISKPKKTLFALFAVSIISTLSFAITSFAVDWDSIPYNIAKIVKVRTGWLNVARNIGYTILVFLAKLVDSFESAIDTLLSINLYSLIKDQFNIESTVYPIAALVAGCALIFVTIMLFLNADKIKISDYLRGILCAMLLIVALPSMFSAAMSLKTHGTSFAKSTFDSDSYYIDEDSGIMSKETLGTKLLANQIYPIEFCIDHGAMTNITTASEYKSNPSTALNLNINETLNTETYNKKPTEFYEPDIISVQNDYETLSLTDRITLIDQMAIPNFGLSSQRDTSLSYLTNQWESREDTYVEYDRNTHRLIVKSGGAYGTSSGGDDVEYFQLTPFTYSANYVYYEDGKYYVPTYHIIQNENGTVVVPTDPNDESKTLTLEWGKTYNGEYFSYQRAQCWNYNVVLCEQLGSELMGSYISNNLPPNAGDYLTTNWIQSNITQASTLGEAIIALESLKIPYQGYEFSVMGWLNVQNNTKIVEKFNAESSGSAEWNPLRTQSEFDEAAWYDQLWYRISTAGYPVESLYHYHFNFLEAFILLVVTIISFAFIGFRISSLMFDVLFVQIVAPIALATDMNGSGRAKQVIMNLLSCNICFIVVIFIQRLYLLVMLEVYKANFGILVTLFITFGGAKFVIDGPDLIVKLTGMDAGIKNGLSTIMGIRTAAQMGTTGAKFVGSTAGGLAFGSAGGMMAGARNGSDPISKVARGVVGTATGALGGVFGNKFNGNAFERGSATADKFTRPRSDMGYENNAAVTKSSSPGNSSDNSSGMSEQPHNGQTAKNSRNSDNNTFGNSQSRSSEPAYVSGSAFDSINPDNSDFPTATAMDGSVSSPTSDNGSYDPSNYPDNTYTPSSESRAPDDSGAYSVDSSSSYSENPGGYSASSAADKIFSQTNNTSKSNNDSNGSLNKRNVGNQRTTGNSGNSRSPRTENSFKPKNTSPTRSNNKTDAKTWADKERKGERESTSWADRERSRENQKHNKF